MILVLTSIKYFPRVLDHEYFSSQLSYTHKLINLLPSAHMVSNRSGHRFPMQIGEEARSIRGNRGLSSYTPSKNNFFKLSIDLATHNKIHPSAIQGRFEMFKPSFPLFQLLQVTISTQQNKNRLLIMRVPCRFQLAMF